MTQTKADPYAGYTLIDPNATSAPRAELVDRPDISTVAPNIENQDAATFAGLTADHALRTTHAQNVPMDAGKYLDIYDKALQDANQYRSHLAESQHAKQLEETFKLIEAQPGGLEEQKARLAAQTELLKKQAEQGPSAVAEAARQRALPGQTGGTTGLISAPSPQQQKDWSAYTEGFNNLKDLHTLFDAMATKTVGAGSAVGSLAGFTTKLTDLTSPEARVYHAYVDSSLIPLAKSIMGDAAVTAGKETVQGAMTEALPTNVDNLQTGGAKMYMFYKRALDKFQTERNMARQNGVDTSSIDTTLNDFRSFFDSPRVQKYNPLNAQPLVQGGTSPQAQATVSNVQAGALAGTNPVQQSPAPGALAVAPSPEALAVAQEQADVYKQANAPPKAGYTPLLPAPSTLPETANAVWDWLQKQGANPSVVAPASSKMAPPQGTDQSLFP